MRRQRQSECNQSGEPHACAWLRRRTAAHHAVPPIKRYYYSRILFYFMVFVRNIHNYNRKQIGNIAIYIAVVKFTVSNNE